MVLVITIVVGMMAVRVPLTRRRVVCTVWVDVATLTLLTVAMKVVETLRPAKAFPVPRGAVGFPVPRGIVGLAIPERPVAAAAIPVPAAAIPEAPFSGGEAFAGAVSFLAERAQFCFGTAEAEAKVARRASVNALICILKCLKECAPVTSLCWSEKQFGQNPAVVVRSGSEINSEVKDRQEGQGKT